MAQGALMATPHQNPQMPCNPDAPDPRGQLKYIPGLFPGD